MWSKLFSFIPGRIYAADNPSYQGDALYAKIKTDLDLAESFCALPSGEFSMWLGNSYNYEDKIWSGHAGAQRMGVNLTLIKAGMRNKKSGMILKWWLDIAIAISCFVIPQSRSPPVQRRFVWPTNLGSSDREDATLDSAPFVRNWRTWNRFIWKDFVRKWSRASLTRSTLLMASATREYFSGLWHFSGPIHRCMMIDKHICSMNDVLCLWVLFIENEAPLLDTNYPPINLTSMSGL